MITFPAPATSNVACEFLALRSPVCFGPQLIGPSRPGRLSADQELLRTPPLPTETLAIAGHPGRSPAQFSLRRGAYLLCFWSCKSPGAFIMTPLPPILSEELQTAGPLGSAGITPPHSYFGPIRLPLAFGPFPGVPGYTAYLAPPISRRDEEGLSSCLARPCHHAVDNHPAGVSHRISLIAMSHAAFAKSLPARPPRLKVSRPPLVRLRYGLVTRRHPFDDVVGRLQNHGFPTDPATQATGLRLLPRWD